MAKSKRQGVIPGMCRESQEQAALIEWLKLMSIPYVAILNEFICNGNWGLLQKFRNMGYLQKGVSDIFIPVMKNGKGGLWLELKVQKGRLSPEQVQWLQDRMQAGYAAVVCYSFEEGVKSIEAYLEGKV